MEKRRKIQPSHFASTVLGGLAGAAVGGTAALHGRKIPKLGPFTNKAKFLRETDKLTRRAYGGAAIGGATGGALGLTVSGGLDKNAFRSFVKAAMALRAGEEAPEDYLPVRAAVHAKFPKLGSAAGHVAELVGLGTLAAPAVQELRGKPMKESNKAKAEVAGLGILAAPYAHDLAKRSKHYAGLAGRIGRAVGR